MSELNKQIYSESDLVDTIGDYFQLPSDAYEESELLNDQLNIIADDLRTRNFTAETPIGKLAWAYINSEPLSIECDESYDKLDDIFN